MSESDIGVENGGYSLRRNNLPPEIIADVLSRLPVKSLCRFKCVTPSWNSLISSPHFSKTHFDRTHTSNPNKHLLQNIILQSTTQDLYAVDITADVPFAAKLDLPSLQPPEDKRIDVLGSCDGLLLFCRTGRSNFFLVNPSTRECKKLPRLPFVLNPGHGSNTCVYGVGYDSSADDYKVVMLSYYESDSESESYALSDTTIVAVYSLKTNAWRRIQDTQYFIHDGVTFGVYFNGCLHGFFWRDGSYLIVAFDLADEVFREVSLPASWVDNETRTYELAVVWGCLCLVSIQSGSRQIEVWTMKEYGVRASWTKTMIEIMTEIDGTCLLVLLGLLAENDFVITKVKILPGVTEEKLVVYNRQTGTLRDIVVPAIPTKFSFLGTYVESLLPCLS